jgi:RNA polymerase sigma-70 factor (ECF subfamily)
VIPFQRCRWRRKHGDPPDHDRRAIPGALLEAVTDAVIVRGALLDLPRDQREALTLRYLGDLSYEEIAAQLGKSNDAVRQICHRGLVALRRALGDLR